MKKFCGKCECSKPVEAFGLDKDSPDGRRYECKECRSRHEKRIYKTSKEKHRVRVNRYKTKNREIIRKKGRDYYYQHLEQALAYRKEHFKEKAETDRKYRESHKEWFAAYSKDYNKRNKDRLKDMHRAYYAKNKKSCLDRNREYRCRNKDKMRRYIREWCRQKRKNDVGYRILYSLRERVRGALAGLRKSARTMELVGCSIEQLKHHLESMFVGGMSWENYGKHGWHIDHIKPCCSFDLTKEEEQRRCFHFTNLQPLWAHDNCVKGGRIAA